VTQKVWQSLQQLPETDMRFSIRNLGAAGHFFG
jgi:hypothetical protein